MATKEKEEKLITVTEIELAAMVAKAVENAKDEIRAEIKNTETNKSDQTAVDNSWLMEEVEMRLFKDGKDYNDDVTVQVNGHCWAIKRGYPVKVPRFVKIQYENSQRQLLKSAEYQQAQQNEFREAKNRFNL